MIIGWSRDADAYREIGAFLRGRGIRMLLWLPVFAENGGDPAVDVFGNAAAAGELGLEGAVLSWNVLQAPEANLEAAASVPG